jgi:hypothetical protein
MHLLKFFYVLITVFTTWKQLAGNIHVYELRYVFVFFFLNRSHLTWVLECLHILYTCSLTVCLWLPQFCHQRSSNLPPKPVPPTPLVHLCERVRWEVAVVSSVLSLSCHVHSCGAWAAQTCPVIAGDRSRFDNDKKRAKCIAVLSLPI